DYGRVQVVKAQLHAAADAAALAGANLVLSDTAAARQAAIETARGNNADGSPVILAAGDVVPVLWDEKQHTWSLPGSGQKANAVKVTAVRTAARGNPVNLMFAKILGPSRCDVGATAIALARPVRYALVGLDYINMQGRSTNSYRTHD